MHQPGENWMYNTGSYALGVLIARASGQSLPTFLRERVFEPLGMKDTGFSVPAAKLDRLASSYWPSAATGVLELHDGVADSRWSRTPAFPDAGAGLVTTVDDYLAFGSMLLNRGTHGHTRVLSRPSVKTMTTDQLTPAQRAASGSSLEFLDGRGWGFGVSIVVRRDDPPRCPGGSAGTAARDLLVVGPARAAGRHHEDPARGLPGRRRGHVDFWTSVYQAIDD
jgi:CubicO group peptidase (beta-lactamase class C family)